MEFEDSEEIDAEKHPELSDPAPWGRRRRRRRRWVRPPPPPPPRPSHRCIALCKGYRNCLTIPTVSQSFCAQTLTNCRC